MKPTFDVADPNDLFRIADLARKAIEAHDNNEWDERTHETDFGDALDELRTVLVMKKPERE